MSKNEMTIQFLAILYDNWTAAERDSYRKLSYYAWGPINRDRDMKRLAPHDVLPR